MSIPPLETLRAFEAAGRLQSYSRAGEELGLTHSAVSRRIRDLEQRVGARLFDRSGNSMVPTDEGRRLLAQVRHAMAMLQSMFPPRATAAGRDRITVSVLPALALRWLVPRLGAFHAAHPEIDLALEMSPDPVNLGQGVDAAVRYGDGSWPGVHRRLLSPERLFPVCSPNYRHRLGLDRPGDLARATLLRHPWHPWSAWFAAAAVDLPEPASGPQYTDSSLLLQAAEVGEGVALARSIAVADALASGALVRPFEAAIDDRYAYYFVRPDPGADAALDSFGDWLAAAMAETRNRLDDQ